MQAPLFIIHRLFSMAPSNAALEPSLSESECSTLLGFFSRFPSPPPSGVYTPLPHPSLSQTLGTLITCCHPIATSFS
ncbi:hypothetical protein QBC43DRAFT_308849 [Cladorrhinum sp. PSN259]|nr:hypothetical protein QBC43DRAFT_308849 [Cladorrhinum sp. PSN259]